MKLLKSIFFICVLAILTACGGGGGNESAPTTVAPVGTTIAANSAVSTIVVNPSASSLNADGTTLVTFTIDALTAGNASIVGATIDLAATNGVILSAASVVTTATGATVTMRANSANQTSRSAVLTASCTACLASAVTSQISVIGATVTLANTGGTALVAGGAGTTLSATIKDAMGAAMSGIPVSFAATDPAVLGLSVSSALTNTSGIASVTVTGLSSGNASVNVSALGNAKTQAYSSGVPAAVLAFTSPANNSVVTMNAPQNIVVAASGATTVTFSTTIGTFANGQNSQTIAVVGGAATAELRSTQGGTATVSLNDSLSREASRNFVISPPVFAANKILLNANQTTLPFSATSGLQNFVELTARAVSYDGLSDQPVANVPIEFSKLGGPGTGEFLTPALKYTDASGYAVATFYSGTSASISNGITIAARIRDTTVQTGDAPSNASARLTIGGQALSVAFGPSSVLGASEDNTLYVHAYSVQVTDANNNPVAGKDVTLRLRPVAFSLGTPCNVTATYCAEDVNGNGSLDAGEDGTRTVTTEATAGACPPVVPAALGELNRNLTPSNSDGGAVPSRVTTDANGVAAFNLTYLKGFALWVVDRLTATVSSNGTETAKSTIFRLPATIKDSDRVQCLLPASPYSY